MCHVLVLDDDLYSAKTASRIIHNSQVATAEYAISEETALVLAQKASDSGNPFDIFIIDLGLGAGKDGVISMVKLLQISPNADSIIITSFDDPDGNLRARQAGAAYFLLRGFRAEELIHLITILKEKSEVQREHDWQKKFVAMMEAAMREGEFHAVSKIVVQYSIQLGFQRAHLFWIPTKELRNQNKLIGEACAGNGCSPNFSKRIFDDWIGLNKGTISRDAFGISAANFKNLIADENEFQLPVGDLVVLPIWQDALPIGALVLDSGQSQRVLKAHELKMLGIFARQVSIVIGHSRSYSWEQKLLREEKKDAQLMQLLQHASVEMLLIARDNEDDLWLTVLTIATANFGLGFNRALLFLTPDDHHTLKGWSGIGADDKFIAEQDWEKDKRRNYQFDDFLIDLRRKKIPITPFGKFIKRIQFPITDGQDALSKVISCGEMQIVQQHEISTKIPQEARKFFDLSTCAILPLRAGNNIFGVVIVDNKHTGMPLETKVLNRLQTLLDNAGLVWETLRQGQKSEDLLDANYKIMGAATHRPLKKTLDLICKTARNITQADWAIIYPIRTGSGQSYEFDVKHIGHDGDLKAPTTSIQRKPRIGGVSEHVLQKGFLKIDDIYADHHLGKELNLQEHHFIRNEGVQAMIGVPITDPYTQDALGILYLDYRRNHQFSRLEEHHARCFASLAAVAISDVHRMDKERRHQRMKIALEISEIIGKELELEKILTGILKKLNSHYRNCGLRLGILVYDDETGLKFIPETLRYYTKFPEQVMRQTFPLKRSRHSSIVVRAAIKALKSHKVEYKNVDDVTKSTDYIPLNPTTKAELCTTIMSSQGNLLGILVLERASGMFDKDDIELVKMVAHNLGLAFERARESEKVVFLSTVSALTAGASDIAHDVNNEVGKIRDLAYLIGEMAKESPKITEYAAQVDESAEKLSSIGSWRAESRRLLQIDRVIQEYIGPMARQRNIQVIAHLNAENASIHANPMELQRILRHLVRNAVRFMSNLPEKKVEISTRLIKDERVEIIFRDFGPGVEEKIRPTIFRRPVSTKDTPKEGGGFGLLLTRLLVEGMGGSIRLLPAIDDQPGASFSIRLPLYNDFSAVE
ncbi:MAG: hypothetical protein CVU44_04315 [Chloroflexi bacterium HGW-Chloroflexi-6]|nr:MAG: hypothetical protein CVU44_04315 [Chloroflexi bacterium HGW-Chloroflexi-6]